MLDKAAWAAWAAQPQLCWGVGTFIAANVGHLGAVLVLEAAMRLPGAASVMIEYGPGHERWQEVQKTWQAVPYGEQWRTALWNMLGPMAILNSVVSSFLLPYLLGPAVLEHGVELPSWSEAIVAFVLLELVGDFFLYTFHRLMHELLWDHVHQYHHSIRTPTPISTVCIENLDATLQGGLPIMLSALVVRPHPLAMYAFVAQRVAENVVNHSGMDHWLIKLIFLKFERLGRAGTAHHDSHHRFSNHAKNAKNFGEHFWIWDWAFGTLGHPRWGTHDALNTKPAAKAA